MTETQEEIVQYQVSEQAEDLKHRLLTRANNMQHHNKVGHAIIAVEDLDPELDPDALVAELNEHSDLKDHGLKVGISAGESDRFIQILNLRLTEPLQSA